MSEKEKFKSLFDCDDKDIRIITRGKVSIHPSRATATAPAPDSPRTFGNKAPGPAEKRRHRGRGIIAVLALLGISVFLFWLFKGTADIPEESCTETLQIETPGPMDNTPALQAEVIATEVTVGDVVMTVIEPENLTPSLVMGPGIVDGDTYAMVMPAAGTRADNGGVVGTCVVGGRIVGRGERKSGFCAVIRGDIEIGVAEAAPAFEQAVVDSGGFFRQYPLVVAGQAVMNRPQGRALRKALVVRDGAVAVVLSQSRMTLEDFARTLAEMGAESAIYLDGGTTPAYWRAGGALVRFGNARYGAAENATYLVWQ